MKIKVFEAFAGYGSQSLALERLSRDYPEFEFEVVGFSEIDPYAIKAYRAIHGDSIPNLGDISQINWGGYNEDFDFLTYSFPCQDISMAGKQRGFERGNGSRSSLLWECERAIECKRPKYLLMENVKALTQKKFSKDFRRWQLTLQEFGYTNYTQVLDASHYGVPQHRERVFMVSVLNNTKPFYFPTPFPLEKRLKDVLEDEVDEKYYLSEKAINGMLFRTTGNDNSFKPCKPNNPNTDDVVNTLTSAGLSKGNKNGVFVQQVIQVGNIYPNTGNPQAGRVYSDTGISPTLDTMDGGNRQPKVITCASRKRGNEHKIEFGNDVANCITTFNTDSMIAEPSIILEHGGMNVSQEKRIYSTEGISCTIDTSCPGRPKIGEHGEVYRIRRITPREAFRLMDVDEESIDKMMGAGISNSQLYRLAGNSIVVSTIYHVFRKIFIDTDAEGINPQLQLF